MDLINLVLVCAAVSLSAALFGAAFLAHRLIADRQTRALLHAGDRDTSVFLVERARLVDASVSARDYLSGLGDRNPSYRKLAAHLSEIFPDFMASMVALPRTRHATLTSFDRTRALTLTMEGTRSRLAIVTAETDVVTLDRGVHASLGAELASLRALGDGQAYPAWRQTADGTITWVNRAYVALVDAQDDRPVTIWPPARLFPQVTGSTPTGKRVSLTGPDKDEHWFECDIAHIGDDLFVSALPIDALIRAESTLSEFMQTFSRTFAQLTVGIAVFDRNRSLVMFNPSLTDLTTLPVDLLLARPKLESFLDALRARNMMPEPKDYASWRDHVLNVERAASNGTYSELWHLTGGRTFRVSGRPQPDGAFALLVEDISAEVSLTRRFRTEIATGRATLDALPDAIAVFDRIGTLVMSNRAYDTLWDIDTQDSLTQMTARDALGAWMKEAQPHPCWAELRNHLFHHGETRDWAAEIRLRNGRGLELQVQGLPSGMTMVKFTAAKPPRRTGQPTLLGQAIVEARLKA